MFSSRRSGEYTLARSPPQSLQAWNFSMIQPASPAGESVSPYAIDCGFVDWIAW